MRKILLCLTLTLASFAASAQTLEPFINFLRSTPAFVNGEVRFVADSVLYEEGWTIVKIVKAQNIEFSFSENWLQVRPGNGFFVKYAGLRVYIDSVTWTPKGVVTESRVPVDITGLSRGYVSSQVAGIIEELFGEKLKRANRILSSVRNQRTIGNVFDKAVSIVHIFTKGDGPGVDLPDYRGEIGLNFLPAKAKAFNLYGLRVSIKEHDHYRSGFSFAGNGDGIYPNKIQFKSRLGTDINQGTEWRALKRLIMNEVTLDKNGIDLHIDLGASQIVTGLCRTCESAAAFPAIRIQVEQYVRTAMMEQVKALWSYLPGLNVPDSVRSGFLRREKCRESNLSCLAKAKGGKPAIAACTQTFRTCMK
ncbi:MAG: hypothetical protein V4598_09620 [Bdellovibrionota bacterium]